MTNNPTREALIAAALIDTYFLQVLAYMYLLPETNLIISASFACLFVFGIACLVYVLCCHRSSIVPVAKQLVKIKWFDSVGSIFFFGILFKAVCPDWLCTYVSATAFIASEALLIACLCRK